MNSKANGEFSLGLWEVAVRDDAGCFMLFGRYQSVYERTGCEYTTGSRAFFSHVDFFYDPAFKLHLSELRVLNPKMDSGPVKLIVMANLFFNTPHSEFDSKR